MSESDALPDGLPTLSDGGRRYDRAKLLAAVESKLFQREPSRVVLGRYVLQDSIGKGGFGIVYRAEDPLLRRAVAIKLLRSRREGDLGGPEALIREARMAALIEHPNVVRVFDVGRVDSPGFTDDVFVVMELLSGQPFSRWRRDHSPSMSRVVGMMLDVCDGLAAAHARKIVHCDVKPANVFVMDDGSAKVVDFGLALHSSQRMSSLASGSSGEEDVEFVAGTPPYMAPEAHEAAPLEPASDQYSFALMLAEAVAGEYPFDGGSSDALFRAKLRGLDADWLKERVPRGLHGILLKATDPQPHRRFISMRALSDALRQWLRPPSVLPWIAGALTFALGGAAVWGATREATCVESPSAAADAWADARGPLREQWTDAWGEQSRLRFEQRLDAFSAEWASAAEQACDVAGAPQCLRNQLGQLHAVLETVSDSEATLQHATVLAAKLGVPAACLEPDEHSPPLPEDASSWAEVERVRDAIARAHAASVAADYDAAVRLAKEALSAATALGYAPVEAEATFQVGAALAEATRYTEALDYLEQAYFAAEGLRHETLVARAAHRLLALHGDRLRDDERARAWLRRARAAVKRLPDEHWLHAALALDVGKLEQHAGNADLARASLNEADRRYAELGQPHERSRVMLILGEVELQTGNPKRAAEFFQEVYEQRKDSVGLNHPYTAYAQGFVARGLLISGDLDGARRNYLAAIAVLGAAVGTMHTSVGGMLGNVGTIEHKLGYLEDSLEHTQRALDKLRTTLPEGHLAFSVAYGNMAQVHLELGNADEAYALDTKALEIRSQKLPPDHPHVIRSHAKIAQGLAGLGRVDEAEAALDEAEAAVTRANIRDPGTRLAIASAAARLGRQPVAQFRALVDELPTTDVAHFFAQFELAKLLGDSDPEEAVALAQEAAEGFRTLGAAPRQAWAEEWVRTRK